MRNPGRVTGADVARMAGVSRATVSYVLNDTVGQSIPEDTREKVRAAADSLGYVPNMAGRALRRGRSDLILCVLPNWPLDYIGDHLIEALAAAAAERRFTLAILHEGDGPAPLASLIRTLSPAAILAIDALPISVERAAHTQGIPVIPAVFGAGMERSASQQQLGRVQAQYLAAQGHRRIGVLSPADDCIRAFSGARRLGVLSACAELGLAVPLQLEIPLDRARMCQGALDWFAAGITAICAYNDDWAMALLSGMVMAGLSAPADLAVIGCDDAPTASVASPPLTTIRQDMRANAALTLDAVARRLGMTLESQVDVTTIELVVRQSA